MSIKKNLLGKLLVKYLLILFSVFLFQDLAYTPVLAKKEVGQELVVMLDPAGDAKNTGRQIDDSLERGITMQFAQKLKGEVEEKLQNTKIVLTRDAGQTIEALQNANFANRLGVDLFLTINFYKETAVKPKVYIYTFSYKDDFSVQALAYGQKGSLQFYSYDMAHFKNLEITKQYADLARSVFLSGENARYFDFLGIFGIPFKPLIGITAPAFAIEIGLNKKDDFNNCTGVFLQIIESIKNIVFA